MDPRTGHPAISPQQDGGPPDRPPSPARRGDVYAVTTAVTAATWVACLVVVGLVGGQQGDPPACSPSSFGCGWDGGDIALLLAMVTWPILFVPAIGVALAEVVELFGSPRARRRTQWVVGLLPTAAILALLVLSVVGAVTDG